MGTYDYPDASEATIERSSESELASRLTREGQRTRFAHGRHWLEPRRGFFEPIHWLARLDRAEARAPGLCLGYRAVLDDGAAGTANGSLPIHLLADLASYREASLPSDGRRYLKRLARSDVRLVWVTDSRLLLEQGYDLTREWSERVGRLSAMPTPERYEARVEAGMGDGSSLVLAGLAGDRLLGYMRARVVDDSAYLLESKVANEGLQHRLSSALDHAAILAFQRTPGVSQVSAGLHQPELTSLTDYKLRYGFPVVHLPARVHLLPPVRLILRRREPLAYYRFTGRWQGDDSSRPYPDRSPEHGPAGSDVQVG